MAQNASPGNPAQPSVSLTHGPSDPAWDIFWKEWAECRTTIGRLDTILVDLRKVGFGLISTLLTASAFFGFSGIAGVRTPPIEGQVPAMIAIMILIAVLSAVDNYYEVLLSGAVERALDLEVETTPHIRLTKYISDNAHRTRATFVTWVLYAVLFAAAFGLGLYAAALTRSGEAEIWVLGIGIPLGILMAANWVYSDIRVGLLHNKAQRHWPEVSHG